MIGALIATCALSRGGVDAFDVERLAEVTVPNLTNRTTRRSHSHCDQSRIDACGLTIFGVPIRRLRPAKSWRRSRVPGSVARRARSVRVWLSAGRKRAAAVPALVGETERTAQLRTRAGWARAERRLRDSDWDYPQEIVVAAHPPARRLAWTGVALLVNRGAGGATYVMPDLIGVNGDRAAEHSPNARFRVAVVGSNPYPGVAAGVVLRQSPQAGFQIGPGEADFDRGEPMSVLIAPSILSADFSALGEAIVGRRARRCRSHSRRRDGRPFRAEHHDRPAGRHDRSSASPRCRSTFTS